VSALPVLQVEWSNGVFVSGMSAGMHLSSSPTVEYGPLLAILPGRDESGTGSEAGGVGERHGRSIAPGEKTLMLSGRLAGMDEIGARLQFGGFFNTYLTRSGA
jgi:outer membrane protein